jgi:MFS family permease
MSGQLDRSQAAGRPADHVDHDADHGLRFWVTAAVGWLVIAIGVRGVVLHHVDTRPRSLAFFVVGGALAHDLLFAPLVVAAGVLVARLLPRRGRGIVQAALIVAGVVALFAYPLVRGFAHATHNPTSLPHDYAANLAMVVAAVWSVAAIGGLLGWRRASRRNRHPSPSAEPGPSERGASVPQ